MSNTVITLRIPVQLCLTRYQLDLARKALGDAPGALYALNRAPVADVLVDIDEDGKWTNLRLKTQ